MSYLSLRIYDVTNSLFIQQELLKMPKDDRLKLYDLSYTLSLQDDAHSQDDYLYMYLVGERDWKKDYGKLKKTKTA